MKMKTAEEIAAFLQPIAASCGAEIYEVVFKQGKNPSLTVFIDSDKEGGVDLDLCEPARRVRPHVRPALYAQREQSGIGQTFQKRQGFL